jgi:hypothetical protein
VDDLILLKIFQSIKQLDSEPPDQVVVKSVEIVDFQEFKKVHRETLKRDTEMLPKDHIIIHMDNVHDIIRVMLLQKHQNIQLHTRLVPILFLVFNHFHSDMALFFVVEAADSGTEGALAQVVLNLIPVSHMISDHDLVVTFIIVVAAVVLWPLVLALHLLYLLLSLLLFFLLNLISHIINLFEVQDLLLLIGCQGDREGSYGLARVHREGRVRIVLFQGLVLNSRELGTERYSCLCRGDNSGRGIVG